MKHGRFGKRSFMAFLLALCLLAGFLTISASAAGRFTDVPETAWYREAVDYVSEKGLFSGTGNGTFSPQSPMTRAMFVQVLSNKTENYQKADWTGRSSFLDVDSGKWYAPAVEWASAAELVSGVGAGRFSPDGYVTREQMALILYRYAQKTGNDTSRSSNALSAFPDAGSVSGWAREAMEWAVSHRIINGSDGRLKPRDTARRCEVAQVFRSADSVLEKTAVEVSPAAPKYADLAEFGNSPEGRAMLQEITSAVQKDMGDGLRFSVSCEGNSLVFSYRLTVEIDTAGFAKKAEQELERKKADFYSLIQELAGLVEAPNPTVTVRYLDLRGSVICSHVFSL